MLYRHLATWRFASGNSIYRFLAWILSTGPKRSQRMRAVVYSYLIGEKEREWERGEGESLARNYFLFRNWVLSHLLGKVFVSHPMWYTVTLIPFEKLRNIIDRTLHSLVSLAFCNNVFLLHEDEKDISTTLSTFAATAHYLVSAWSILRPRAESRVNPDAHDKYKSRDSFL